MRVDAATTSATATCSSSPTEHVAELDAALDARRGAHRRRARHHPRAVPAADARPRAARARPASSSRATASLLIRGVPVERYGKAAGVDDLLGRRDAPREPVAAERQGPPARRRHRPGPRDRRPHRPRQRDRRHRVPVPLRRLGPRRPLLPRRRGESAARASWRTRVTIHNELVRTEPELAAELYAPFAVRLPRRAGPGRASPGTRCRSSPLRRTGCSCATSGRTSSRPAGTRTRPGRRDAAREAMDRVDAMCADPQFHVSMTMRPGDMQFVNNYHVLHARDGVRRRPRGRAGSAT